MTIFQVMGCCSSKFGGVEKFLLKLCETNPENKYIFVFDVKPYSDLFISRINEAGGTIEVIDGRGYKLFTNSLKFCRLVKKHNPSYIHFHFSNQYCVWGPLSKLLGVKSLYKTTHGCVFRKGIQVQKKSQLGFKQMLLTCNGLIYRIFDKTICVSEYVKEQLCKIYGDKDKFECVYLGTASPVIYSDSQKQEIRKRIGISDDEIVISSIMFAAYMKGGDVLITAFADICKGRRLKLILIGLDPNHAITKKLEQLARGLGIYDKIVWPGITDNVQQFLNITDIYVQPSRTEALSLAAVEALSYAIPVVGSDVGGLPEASSVVFPNEDCKALSSLLEILISDKQYRCHLGTQGRERWKKKMNIEKGVKYYINLYHH